ncbi:MAG: efflux RND transporter periplasmic adaptor subunit, partial [Treponema sp.]|nr:efflux RND transporter periplasmic adaptor subunit [Treponema sp.]
MKTTMRLALSVTLLAALALSGCERIKAFREKGKAGGPAEAPAVVFAVNTTTAVQGPIQDYIALSGDIIAGTQV